MMSNALKIFLFHGVCKQTNERVRNYNRKHIPDTYFRDFLKTLISTGHIPLSMDDVVIHWQEQIPLPKHCFTVTFDDGFENNYSLAAPILDELQIPATFYITTSFIENNLMSWVDQIDYCIENFSLSTFTYNGISYNTQNISDKITTLERIRKLVKNTPSINPYEFAQNLFDLCKVPPKYSDNNEFDLKMTWKQINLLSQSALFTIGGHSHTHRIMSFLSESELIEEVEKCLNILSSKTDTNIMHYSYPEGMNNCYGEREIKLLQKKGIVCSPSAITGVNTLADSLFHLKRITVV